MPLPDYIVSQLYHFSWSPSLKAANSWHTYICAPSATTRRFHHLWTVGSIWISDLPWETYPIDTLELWYALYNYSLLIPVCTSVSQGGTSSPVRQSPRKKERQQHGMSMASSIACGSIALLISGLKAENASSSSTSLRRAIENTCMPVGDEGPESMLAYGRGLLQVRQ